MELVFASPHQHRPSGDATNPKESPAPTTALVAALELAAQSAKQLSSPSSAGNHPTQALAALASLRSAHQMIGSFLAQLEAPSPSGGGGDEPMSDCGDGEEEAEGGGGEGWRIIEEVEEGMRDCVLQSKRRKRRVSPSWPGGRAADRVEEESSVNPMDRRRSSLDLIFQFHA